MDTLGHPAKRLEGKAAVVTGAGYDGDSPGIGAAIAIVFARAGARIWVLDIDERRALATCAHIEREGGAARLLVGDLTDEAICRSFAATVAAETPTDILVNNLGVSGAAGTLEQLDVLAWRRIFDINLTSAVMMCQVFMPQLLSKRGGAIVNIASLAGLRAHGGGAAYGPSKAALVAFTRELAVLYGDRAVRANAIAPGHIYGPMVSRRLDQRRRELRRLAAPLDREGSVWDVAAAALFLGSDESRFVSGVCLPVDGGANEFATLPAITRVQHNH